ncbi:MAG TPA: hypothetical protein VFZ42_15380 [Chitinophagaceae bacterium]
MKKFLAALVLAFFNLIAQSQDLITDLKGNFLFGVPTTTIQPQLSSNNVGVTTPITYAYRKMYYVTDPSTGESFNTMQKSKVAFTKFNVVSNSKSTLVFNKRTNVSPILELGFAWGVDTLYHPSAKKGTYFTISASVFGEYQNFKYYDTITQTFGKEKTSRISPGIRCNVSIFYSTAMAISFSAMAQKSVLTDNLKNYEKRSNTFYFDNNVTTNGQNDGYLLPITPIENYRISISAPQFWFPWAHNKKLPFVVTPYYFGTFSKGNIPNNNAGIILSFLPAPFRRFDRNKDGSLKPDSKFKFDKIINLGYNHISSGNKDPRYFFVSGTFNLGVFKPKPKNDFAADPNSKQTFVDR